MATATYAMVLELAQQLTPAEQERLIEDLVERRWDAAFERSQDALAQLAANALADVAAGRTELLDGPNPTFVIGGAK
jgi:hypothetical protein